jgi:protein-tyrosine phosphatase
VLNSRGYADMNIKSVMNFRDIGGIPTNGNGSIKKGIIFRSATVDRISREDANKFKELDIRTIIDLRAPQEVKKRRRSVDHIFTLSLPLDFQKTTRERLKPYLYKKGTEKILADISNQLYLDILDTAAPVFRQIMELLVSDDGAPVLIHCQAGKDRTGILVALILLALGSDRQLIVDDFLKSNDALLPYFKKLLLIRKIISFGFFPARRMLYVITAKQRNIDSVIDRVQNHYGGIEGYLASAGFEISRLKDLRERLCTA